MPPVEPSLQMWLTLALTGAAVVAYALEVMAVELVALGILGALLLLFQLFPLVAGRTRCSGRPTCWRASRARP